MNKLKIAIQKSGRLHDESVKLLKECGLAIVNGNKQKLRAQVQNFPAELLFLRDDDIPQYVADKVVDVGMVGENVVLEKKKMVEVVHNLGFARCRLSLAISSHLDYDDISYFHGKKIATSYPNILADYLNQNQVEAEIHEINGSVEIAPGIGLADGICDLVSTGSTLFSNGLKEVDTILRSEAVLASSPQLSASSKEILDKLIFRIKAVNEAKVNKYLLLNAPTEAVKEISAILPGMKSPTVLPLHTPGWSSIHSVVNENQFWGKIDELKALGAQGILVVPIEKMIR